jgi:hypothetical protein
MKMGTVVTVPIFSLRLQLDDQHLERLVLEVFGQVFTTVHPHALPRLGSTVLGSAIGEGEPVMGI